MSEAQTPKPPFELDPFALPQETRARFHMFIAAAVMLAWSLGGAWIEVPNIYNLPWNVTPELQEQIDRTRATNDLASTDLNVVFRELRTSGAVQQWKNLIVRQLGRLALSVVIVAVAALLAFGLYRLHPWLLSRRYHTTPLKDAAIDEEVRRLSVIAGIQPPQVVLKPGFLDGLAFGLKGREVLALGGQRSLLARRWNPFQRAVTLHELAHILNGDIRTRVLSSSIWTALTLVLALVGGGALLTSLTLSGSARLPVFPLLVETTGEGRHAAVVAAQSVVLLLTVLALWSELIRAREFYADARVATWGARDTLLATLRLPDARRGRWLWRRLHPPHHVRVDHLENPLRLFRTSRRLAFLTGLLLTLLGAQMTPLSTDLTFMVVMIASGLIFFIGPVVMLPLPLLIFAGLCLLAYFVTCALGIQVRRETVAELTTSPHHQWGYLRLLRTAFFFALGLETGLFLSPFNPFSFWQGALWNAAWLALLTALVWIWLVYLKAANRFLLGTALKSPRVVGRLITGSSTVLLAALLGSALMFRLTIEAGYNFDHISQLALPGTNPVEFFVFMFVITSIFLLVASLAFCVILGCCMALFATYRLLRQRRCTTCAELMPRLLLIGRRCRACQAPCVSWPYLGEPR